MGRAQADEGSLYFSLLHAILCVLALKTASRVLKPGTVYPPTGPVFEETIEDKIIQSLVYVELKVRQIRESSRWLSDSVIFRSIRELLESNHGNVLTQADQYPKELKWPLSIDEAEALLRHMIVINALLLEAFYSWQAKSETFIMPSGFLPILLPKGDRLKRQSPPDPKHLQRRIIAHFVSLGGTLQASGRARSARPSLLECESNSTRLKNFNQLAAALEPQGIMLRVLSDSRKDFLEKLLKEKLLSEKSPAISIAIVHSHAIYNMPSTTTDKNLTVL
ncbi:hypothetical protein Ddc_12288 [Ditylenchus destructor]|nr:hypothetical protein Ddc_12288 [Ditylenchus destructor]